MSRLFGSGEQFPQPFTLIYMPCKPLTVEEQPRCSYFRA